MNFAINSLKNNKPPGQNRSTAELIKALDEANKAHFLKLLNKCYRDSIFKEMNQADLVIIYERSHRQTRELQTNSTTELKLQDTSQNDTSQAL